MKHFIYVLLVLTILIPTKTYAGWMSTLIELDTNDKVSNIENNLKKANNLLINENTTLKSEIEILKNKLENHWTKAEHKKQSKI